jgi:hypothetical protein
MSSSNGNEKPPRKVSEEAAVFNTFALVIRNKFAATPASPTEHDHSAQTTEERVKRLDQLYNGPEYKVEKEMLTRMNNSGMVYGLACGLFTFGILRTGPKFIQRTLIRRKQQQQRSSSGYSFDQPSAGDAQFRKPGFLFRTIRLGLDLTLSTSVAAYGSALFTDKAKLMNEMASIPLVSGRSLIADELCDDFIDVYKGIPKKTWKKYEGKSEALDAISGFVMNCMKRKVVEKEILEQNQSFGITDEGSAENGKAVKHVEIPTPGVSPDIIVEIQFGDKSEDLQVGRESEGDDDFGGFEDLYGTSYMDDEADSTNDSDDDAR